MFNNIALTAVLDEFGEIKTELVRKSDTELEISDNEYIKGSVTVKKYDKSYIISADVEVVPYPYHYYRCFDAYKGLTLEPDMNLSEWVALAIERYNPFWTRPVFFDDFTTLTDNTQHILIKNKNEYIHIMPLSGAQAQCCAVKGNKKNTLRITAGRYFGGSTKIKADICVISYSDNPYKAVEMSYNAAYENGIILTPPKREKEYPKQLEGLGWCTWNAFYHDVTAQGIEEKLKEFRAKDIPIKWIMIDDGWAQTENFKLKSCVVDRKKFPDGLKSFIEYIKREYKIEYVGIWHAFTGYWFGLDSDGEQYLYNKENFIVNNSDIIIPGGEEATAYEFFSQWHKYLKSEGIDFLKVDVQGGALEFFKNTNGACRKTVNLHNALERSVSENFGSVMINCMGLGNLDMFSRNRSSVIRNSDDFFPDEKDGFESHIMQNAYNAIFNDNLYFCDYDMWWTKHISAKQSSVLRAVSGGPVYISDKTGETQREYLLPIIGGNGNVLRCDNAAKPTADCVFKNPQNGVLKIFNTAGENCVIAIFNLSDEKQTTEIYLKDIYSDGDYYMHRYSDGLCDCFKDGMNLMVEPNGVEVINLYKIKDGTVMLGRRDKYISIACPDEEKKIIRVYK